MSISSTRADLVAALAALEGAGVHGFAYPTDTKRPGDAWPLWTGAVQPEDGPYVHTFVQTWQVHVVLPPDPQAADEWVTTHIDDLVDAVAAELSITGYGPGRITPQGTSAAYNALIITGETE